MQCVNTLQKITASTALTVTTNYNVLQNTTKIFISLENKMQQTNFTRTFKKVKKVKKVWQKIIAQKFAFNFFKIS